MNKGTFISVEGIDGSGKTSNTVYLAKYLESLGYKVFLTRDPGGSELGEKLRPIVKEESMSSMTELFLFAAIRQQLIDEIIIPKVAEGYIVITDRFCDSTYAYQGAGRDLKYQVNVLEKLIGDGLFPDITLFLNVSLATSLARIKQRSETQSDKFDFIKHEFKVKVYNGFMERIEKYPNRFHLIDAENELEEVQENIKDWVKTTLIPYLNP